MTESTLVKHIGLTIPAEGFLSNKNLYNLGVEDRMALQVDALNFYAVPGRGYHGVQHPLNMLRVHKDVWGTDPTDALFLSILMHDAVYVPGQSPGSEDMSMHLVAPLYYRVLGTRIPTLLNDEIIELVHWTLPRYHVRDNRKTVTGGPNGLVARLLDLDLCAMSSDWKTFVRTQESVEFEFLHTASTDVLKLQSAEFLETFIAKGFVYYTDDFQSRNVIALRNLKAVVQAILVHKEYKWDFMAARDPDLLASQFIE